MKPPTAREEFATLWGVAMIFLSLLWTALFHPSKMDWCEEEKP